MTSSRAVACARRVVRASFLILVILVGVVIHDRSANAATHIAATTYTANATWTSANSPYVIDGNVTVAAGVTLTVEPGVIVKFSGTARTLQVNGTLNASGTAENSIYFTSLQDDSVGGDTGGDGSTSGAPGQWSQIQFAGSSSLSQLRHVFVRFGGYGFGNPNAELYVNGPNAAATISDAQVTDSKTTGIDVYQGSATIGRTRLEANVKHGIYVDHGQVSVDHSKIESNQGWGAYVFFNSSPYPSASTFYDNAVTANALGGIFMWGANAAPTSSWPHGNRNNIYDNNSSSRNGNQLYSIGLAHDASVDWSNNYWGSDVHWVTNSGGCGDNGYLAYNGGSSPPTSPLPLYSWGVFPSITCWTNVPLLTANGWAPAPFEAPNNTALPFITGFANKDETLGVATGSWTDNPTNFAYQWQRCDANGTSCVALFGQTAALYLLTDSDVGHRMRVVVTATNTFGSTTATSAAYLIVLDRIDVVARAYRPALLFDSNEHYRPITINSLLAESDGDGNPVHRRCDTIAVYTGGVSTTCGAINSTDGLLAPAPPGTIGSFLSIWPYHADNEEYRSPTCSDTSFLRDCGDTTGAYYDYQQRMDGYRFIDYWIFYRYNPIQDDEHEGDWEGVTVELNPDPAMSNSGVTGSDSPVTGVVYWAHGHATFRLASALSWCPDGATDQSACSSAVDSTHAATFVAGGSHASYESPCFESACFNPRRDDYSETRHDGAAGWVANADSNCASDCLTAMTPVAGGPVPPWVSWAGIWGGSTGNDATFDKSGRSPASPGLQAPFLCTQAAWNCDTVPDGDPMPLAFRRAGATSQKTGSRSQPRRAGFAFRRCASWYDAGLGGFACSPSQLSKTVASNRLSRPGHFSIAVAGRHAGTAPGLVQVIGGPLSEGAMVRFRGSTTGDEIVVLNCFLRHHEYAIQLTELVVHGKAPTAAVRVRRGKPLVMLNDLTARKRIRVLTPPASTTN